MNDAGRSSQRESTDARMGSEAAAPQVSAVVPVLNEAANLAPLHQRLTVALQATGRSYEIWYVDDGSRDDSPELLRSIAARDPRVGLIELTRNFGQHAAVLAGFAAARGEVIVSLDADLQNPPEEIPRLLAKVDEGYDVVGGRRAQRRDSVSRRLPSALLNRLIARLVGVRMDDYGCMLRAYRRPVVEQLVACNERASFLPALANVFARRPTEIDVGHESRVRGASRYGPLKLLRLSLDLITGFSLFPIQLVSLFGMVVVIAGAGLGVASLAGAPFGGDFSVSTLPLLAMLFVVLGMLFLALGLIGEYVGRIYLEVRRRPTYCVHAIRRPRS